MLFSILLRHLIGGQWIELEYVKSRVVESVSNKVTLDFAKENASCPRL